MQEHITFLLLVYLYVLRFYGPVNPMRSCRARSFHLTTLLIGRLSPLSGQPVLCIFFRQKLTTALLESRKGENDRRKYFIISLHERMLPSRQKLNPQLPDRLSDARPSEPPKPASFICTITKTYLYNFDHLKPHFYIVKLGFTGVYIIFLVSAQKHRLWVLVRTASPRRF